MAITGTTNTCQILTNTPFVLSGLTQTNLSTINITDENGLDVSECFGITTNIITVDNDNVTVTGDCNTSLEIKVTEGIVNEVECLYTGYTEQQNGLLLFEYADGTVTDNVHPECCLSLGYEPEIGDGMYYVCRSIEEIDVTDCDNYIPTYEETVDSYQIFEFVTGGTVTTVPSAECCYAYGFVETIVNGEIKCIVEEEYAPCGDLVVVEPVPTFGDITFIDPNTGIETVYVPTSECCTSLGYNFTEDSNGFKCYQSTAPKPTVSITNDECCLEVEVEEPTSCKEWNIDTFGGNIPSGEGLEIIYIDCNGNTVAEVYTSSVITTICAQEIQSIIAGSEGYGLDGTPLQPGTYNTYYGSVSGGFIDC